MAVDSPCIKYCVVDWNTFKQGVCAGCGRTIEEVGSWSQITDNERLVVKEQAKQRLQILKERE